MNGRSSNSSPPQPHCHPSPLVLTDAQVLGRGIRKFLVSSMSTKHLRTKPHRRRRKKTWCRRGAYQSMYRSLCDKALKELGLVEALTLIPKSLHRLYVAACGTPTFPLRTRFVTHTSEVARPRRSPEVNTDLIVHLHASSPTATPAAHTGTVAGVKVEYSGLTFDARCPSPKSFRLLAPRLDASRPHRF